MKVVGISKEEEIKYQNFLLEKLGKVTYAQGPDEFTVDHEITVCGKVIKIPVINMQIDEQKNLITQDITLLHSFGSYSALNPCLFKWF